MTIEQAYFAGVITGVGMGVGLHAWLIPFAIDVRNRLLRAHILRK